MKATLFAVTAILTLSIVFAAPQSGSANLLVTTEWLSKHLQDKDLVVLHSNWTRSSYKKAHIPGARFLWINGLAKDTPDRSTELPSKEEAAAILRDLGINNDSKVVVYFEGSNMTMTTRMILTLTYLGMGDRVSLLDGGFDAWKAENRPVTSEIPKVTPGTYTPTLHPEVVTDADWVKEHLSDPNITIIDARAKRFYDGSSGGSSAGHVPHSVSIPFSSVADSTNRILDPAALRDVLAKAGVKPGSQLVTYCHVGQQATLVAFAARYIGYNVKVYDGSFEDWSDRGLPIENPAEKKTEQK